MRTKRAFKNISKITKRYEEEVLVISKNNTLDKNTGRFINNRTEKVRKLALFKKKSKYVLKVKGGVVEADIKVYSLFFLNAEDKSDATPDVVKHNDNLYKIISIENRVECSPHVYIAYGVRVDD